MNQVPKFCPFCGGKLVVEHSAVSSWQQYLHCGGCKKQALVTFGDMLGGAPFCEVNWDYKTPIAMDRYYPPPGACF